MLVPFARTLILYFCIILAIRLMGKRQVGEMQPMELVSTILVSAVAAVPMQDMDIPLAHGLVPVVTLIAAEVLLSALSLKNLRLRQLLSGKPVPVIREGIIDRKALSALRLSLDDLLEELRLNGVFDPRRVTFAQVETNGKLSFLLDSADAPLTPRQAGIRAEAELPFFLIVSDGTLLREGLRQAEKSEVWLRSALKKCGVQQLSEVFLFCADKSGNTIFLRRAR